MYALPVIIYNGFGMSDNTTFSINASGSADIKNQKNSFGFEFEQRDNREVGG
jgi:hypothetical protein